VVTLILSADIEEDVNSINIIEDRARRKDYPIMQRKYGICLCVLAISLIWAGISSAAPKGGIPQSLIDKLQNSKQNNADGILGDIIANRDVSEIALNRQRYIEHNKIVNFRIKTGDVTNQKSSGRCWLFSAMNVFRPQIIKKYKLKNFEFSEIYLTFWDKLEKSNTFLQGMIDLAGRPADDRELEILKKDPIGDGGWWTYFVDLVDKYGLVPKEAMPETYNSSATGSMNNALNLKLKEMGMALRGLAQAGVSPDSLAVQKSNMLAEIYRLLTLNLGKPPVEFVWRYESTDSTAAGQKPKTYTPQSFRKEVIGDDLYDYVAMFNYAGKNYFDMYRLKQSRNIYDRTDFTVLNVPVDTLKTYALKSILDSTPVWFACDVGKEDYGAEGIMALDIYDYEKIYGTTFKMPKADLIYTELITPNHAMAFVGVDTLAGQPQKWLVENSWGGERGDKGYWYMYNDWFDRYMFGVIIKKKYLSKEILALSNKTPIELPPWDPMYALTRLK
jgi:bleomycin hydrolase